MTPHEILLWVCTVLSYSVLIFTCIYKAPQIYAVLHSGSSVGISLASLSLEFTSYSIEMTYQFAMEYPLETYFEIMLMWAQDVIFVFVVLSNRHLMGANLLPHFFVYCFMFTCVVNRWFPNVIMYSLIGSTTPILFFSKTAQLVKVIRTKNPGTLSSLTWGLLTYMSAVRVLTTVVITGDIPIFFNVFTSTILDAAVFISIVYYNWRKRRRRRWR